MTLKTAKGPQGSLLFKCVALLSRLQMGYLLRLGINPRILVLLFVCLAGTVAVGIISAAAYLTNLPLLYPPLGPSAFVLFYVPMSATASPRSVILSHTIALTVGILSLHLFGTIWPEANLLAPSTLNWPKVCVIALSMGITCVAMLCLRCEHSPASGTALIAAMGYLADPVQVLGFVVAVGLLVAEAFFFNRILGGLPYPTWEMDPKVSKNYGILAGIPQEGTNYWKQLSAKMFERRLS